MFAVTASLGGSTNCVHSPAARSAGSTQPWVGAAVALSPKASTSWSWSASCQPSATSACLVLAFCAAASWKRRVVAECGCGFHGVGCRCVGYTVCFSCFLLLWGLAAPIAAFGLLGGVCGTCVPHNRMCPGSGWQHLARPKLTPGVGMRLMLILTCFLLLGPSHVCLLYKFQALVVKTQHLYNTEPHCKMEMLQGPGRAGVCRWCVTKTLHIPPKRLTTCTSNQGTDGLTHRHSARSYCSTPKQGLQPPALAFTAAAAFQAPVLAVCYFVRQLLSQGTPKQPHARSLLLAAV